MTGRFQDAALVASPSYPDAIAWSQENLIAVASGHIVTILNPAFPSGPRGLITIPANEPYLFGTVKREDLLTDALLSSCINRDRRPCARSLSWSHIGMAPNFGCLLAVCTADGHVKIYRPPFCDFCAEWIEIIDMTDLLYDYLSKIDFGDASSPSLNGFNDQEHQPSNADEKQTFFAKKYKRRKVNPLNKMNQVDGYPMDRLPCSQNWDGQDGQPRIPSGTKEASNKVERSSHHIIISLSQVQEKDAYLTPRTLPTPLISAEKYASRDAALSSLVVAWSPLLRLSSKNSPATSKHHSNWFSLLAVGLKSGGVAIWKIYVPESYQIEHSNVSTSMMFIGLLQAHASWVTTLSWILWGADSSNPQMLLVTGSFDGSVKIWMSYAEELQMLAAVNTCVFTLFEQVVAVNHVPVSALSPVVPVQASERMLLAIGKSSGSLEVWIYESSGGKFEKSGSCNAHDLAVMSLAWDIDGCRLYSCGQDNFVRSWGINESSLVEIPIASSIPGPRSSSDLPDAFLSCLGVAMSPGRLAIAVVRSFNTDLLDQMYQARIQKAAVEFIWNGWQKRSSFENFLEDCVESTSGFPEKEMVNWEYSVLWSLKQLENVDKPLVVWDIIAVLTSFKHSVPEYVEHTIMKWLSMNYLGSSTDLLSHKVFERVSKSLFKATSRQLQLLNVISRCVMLSDMKADSVNSELQKLSNHNYGDEQRMLWLQLLQKSENELRERLVGYILSSFLIAPEGSSQNWNTKGLAPMVRWIELTTEVHDQLRSLASEMQSRTKSSNQVALAVEERCCYCSSSVPFDSPNVAFCQGSDHKLERCAVSMQVCSSTSSWFCKCCHRWISALPPEAFFLLPSRPSDFNSLPTPTGVLTPVLTPFCPFCGILLQRLQPEFLLSASPV